MVGWRWESFQAIVHLVGADPLPAKFTPPGPVKSTSSGRLSYPVSTVIRCDPALPDLYLAGNLNLNDTAELAASLGLASSSSDDSSTLVLHAYAKWGDRTPLHLSGQFSFAIRDDRQNSLFACRDHLGTLPFVYSHDGNHLAFAGDMETMVSGFNIPRVLNADTLSACKALCGLRVASGATFFVGIQSLPPGHFLTANERGVRVAEYWRPEIRPELIPKKEGEVYEQIRHLVGRAVAGRLRGRSRPALMFSGGLDSSVLAVVAAEQLKKKNLPLLAVAAVSEHHAVGMGDEREYMAALEGFGNLDIVYVKSEGRGPFDGIEDPGLFHTSCVRYSRRFIDLALAEAAGSGNADLLFCGAFGEFTISTTPAPYMLECASRFRLATLYRDLRSRSRRTGYSSARLFGGELFRHIRPSARPIDSVFLNPEFLRTHSAAPMGRRPIWPDTRKTELKDLRDLLNVDALYSTRPRDFVFTMEKPFEDKDLLEFCLAAPAKYKMQSGIGRQLLRKAFEGSVPEAIIRRTGKVLYCPDYSVRYARQSAKALDFVRAIRKSDPVADVVDLKVLANSIQPPGSASVDQRLALTPIPRTIYLINFLRQFPAFRV